MDQRAENLFKLDPTQRQNLKIKDLIPFPFNNYHEEFCKDFLTENTSKKLGQVANQYCMNGKYQTISIQICMEVQQTIENIQLIILIQEKELDPFLI